MPVSVPGMQGVERISKRDLGRQDPSGWDLRLLRRADGPPLRFHGRLAVDVGGPEPFVRFWEVRRGGVVLEHSLWSETGGRIFARRFDDAEAAMAALEAQCAALRQAEPPQVVQAALLPDLAAALVRSARWMEWTRAFLVLAGEALDRLDGPLPAMEAMQ